jgi:hypothetical protein
MTRSECRPVVLDEIERCLDELDAWDGDGTSMAPSRVSPAHKFYEVRYLVAEVRRLKNPSETEIPLSRHLCTQAV